MSGAGCTQQTDPVFPKGGFSPFPRADGVLEIEIEARIRLKESSHIKWEGTVARACANSWSCFHNTILGKSVIHIL